MRELSLHILDIAENSIRAQATEVYIEIEENIKQNFFRFFISDNGCGMDEELLKKVRSPFGTSRTTRKVGLGIPLLEEACKRCNGKLDIESTPGKGTTLTVSMEYNHIDRAPMGDIVSTIVTLIGANPHIDFVYKHLYNNSPFILDTKQIKELLDGAPISDIAILQWLKEYIKQGLSEIRQS